MIFRLNKEPYFPDPTNYQKEIEEEEGLFAIGGELSQERLIQAYYLGIFPWTDIRCKEFLWFCPVERFVIFPSEIHISHSMRNLINKKKYHHTVDKCFSEVINNCSKLRIEEEGAWLGKDMIEAYTKLHESGIAHSVETWEGDQLVGGFYGLLINEVFFGESMFSLKANASKFALIEFCKNYQIKLVDCQMPTDHLKSLGGKLIAYKQFREIIGSI